MHTIQKQIIESLSKASIDYYKIGVAEYYKMDELTLDNIQTTIGNLAISIELMLKTIIAQNDLFCLYDKKQPKEVNGDFNTIYEKLVSGKIKNLTEKEKFYLVNFTFKSKKIDECISCIKKNKKLSEDLKFETNLNEYLKKVRKVRNDSVHGIIPMSSKFSVYNLLLVSKYLIEYLRSNKIGLYRIDLFSKKEIDAFQNINKKLTTDVESKIKNARKKALKCEENYLIDIGHDWNSYITECPVCSKDCVLEGITGEYCYEEDLFINFEADSLKCEFCGLELNDYEELKIAGIETSIERDSDLERWVYERENGLI